MTLKTSKELTEKIIDFTSKIEQQEESSLLFFGAGFECYRLLDWFCEHELPLPLAICDNNSDKQGQKIKKSLLFLLKVPSRSILQQSF